jgi:hypothetical protein
VKKNGDQISRYDSKSFNQIAYGRSPMIFAALQAHALSGDGDKKYLDLACQLAMWFFGENPAKAMMYDPVTEEVLMESIALMISIGTQALNPQSNLC